jgi:hypothetical protein
VAQSGMGPLCPLNFGRAAACRGRLQAPTAFARTVRTFTASRSEQRPSGRRSPIQLKKIGAAVVESPHDFSVPMHWDLAVTDECRRFAFVSQILLQTFHSSGVRQMR